MRLPLILLLANLGFGRPCARRGCQSREAAAGSPRQRAFATVTTKPVIMINKATEAELIQHENIGSLYAKRVIANRPYDGPEDFRKRSGLPSESFDKVKDLLDF